MTHDSFVLMKLGGWPSDYVQQCGFDPEHRALRRKRRRQAFLERNACRRVSFEFPIGSTPTGGSEDLDQVA